MGLFSFIGSICSGIASAFRSVCSSAISIVAKLPVVGPVAKQILEIGIKLGKVIFEGIAKAITKIGQILGVIAEKMDPAELGERARQNPNIRREDCASTEEYIQKLQQAPYDPNVLESKKNNPIEYMADAAHGLAITKQGIEEKVKMTIPISFFESGVKGGMDGKDMCVMLDKMKGAGLSDAGAFHTYLAGGNLSSAVSQKLGTALAAYDQTKGVTSVGQIQTNVANFKEQVEQPAAVKPTEVKEG